jgi:hypothetical protein
VVGRNLGRGRVLWARQATDSVPLVRRHLFTCPHGADAHKATLISGRTCRHVKQRGLSLHI